MLTQSRQVAKTGIPWGFGWTPESTAVATAGIKSGITLADFAPSRLGEKPNSMLTRSPKSQTHESSGHKTTLIYISNEISHLQRFSRCPSSFSRLRLLPCNRETGRTYDVPVH
jgi:hypothetical protein